MTPGPHPCVGGPDGTLTAWLFDLDGVITDTASLHAEAWKEMFDAFLEDRRQRSGTEHPPFGPGDYTASVDGRLRQDGVRAFLASRGIVLPEGDPADPPEAETVHGLANRKNVLFQQVLARDGVKVYPSTVEWAEEVAASGRACAVVSASRNCQVMLAAAGLEHLFSARVDGVVAAEMGLRGKPEADTFLEAARRLGAAPSACAVVEDALSGVEAGRAGGFGWVIGVDRAGHAEALAQRGAHVVVSDMAELVEHEC